MDERPVPSPERGPVDPSEVCLAPMTDEMVHRYLREYENDPDLFMPGQEYVPYVYSEERAERYIQRQRERNRVHLAVLYRGEIAGEIVIKNIEEHKCATMGIALKNDACKNRGIGTAAEVLAVRFVFHELDIPTLYADALRANTRSQHVLEKVGFTLIREDADFRYYRIDRDLTEEGRK